MISRIAAVVVAAGVVSGCATVEVQRLPNWTAIDEPQTISPPLLLAETEYDSKSIGLPTGDPPAGIPYAVVDVRKTMPDGYLIKRLREEAEELRADYVIVSEPFEQEHNTTGVDALERPRFPVLRGVLYRAREAEASPPADS